MKKTYDDRVDGILFKTYAACFLCIAADCFLHITKMKNEIANDVSRWALGYDKNEHFQFLICKQNEAKNKI